MQPVDALVRGVQTPRADLQADFKEMGRGAGTCVESSVSPTNVGRLIPIAFGTPPLP